MTWWDETLVGFDLETTSPDPREARIVTAAIVICRPFEPEARRVTRIEWLADPGVEIPEEAAAIHGVSTERARAEGQPAADVVRHVAESLATLAEHPLVVFNARYDLTVTDRECRRHGIGPLPLVFGPTVDPLVIDKQLDRFRRGSRKLDAMCAQYGATLDAAHSADDDALAACRAAWVLGAKGRVIRQIRQWGGHARHDEAERAELEAEWEAVRYDVGLLHEAQQRWAEAERVRFAEYKRSIGDDETADRVEDERGWPVLEQGAHEVAHDAYTAKP